jgi:hypothetical protein
MWKLSRMPRHELTHDRGLILPGDLQRRGDLEEV